MFLPRRLPCLVFSPVRHQINVSVCVKFSPIYCGVWPDDGVSLVVGVSGIKFRFRVDGISVFRSPGWARPVSFPFYWRPRLHFRWWIIVVWCRAIVCCRVSAARETPQCFARIFCCALCSEFVWVLLANFMFQGVDCTSVFVVAD